MKRLISAVLAVIMLAGTMSFSISADWVYDVGYTLGNADASDDNSINAMDLFALKTYNIGREVVIDKQAADLAADGIINTQDMFYLKGMILGTVTAESLGDKEQTATFQIAGTDISEFAIVLPAGHDWLKNTHYSADQFKKYVKLSTGYNLSIVNEGEWNGPSINFYQHDRKSSIGQELGTEGYKYDVTDGDLNIHGTYRGCMYAVWEILENYLGIRFFEDTYFYKQRFVNIEEGTSAFVVPLMKFRFTGQNVRKNAETYYYPRRMNGSQLSGYAEERYGYQYGPSNCNAHSYDMYWAYGTGTMPEDDGTLTLDQRYEAMYQSGEKKDLYGWQPCATKEEDYQVLFKGMITHLNRLENWGIEKYQYSTTVKHCVEDGQKSASFSLNDNEIYCSCRNCRNKANGWTDRKTGIYYPPEGWSGVYVDLANKAARDVQDYYPGMRVHTILYNHAIPHSVRPDKNLIVFYCGQGCNNHYLGSTECGECTGQIGRPNNNQLTNQSLKSWGQFCKESGAEMWFWYYGVTYAYVLVSMPNVINLYYDYKYLYEECNVSGIYYEGGGRPYNYGNLKAYMSAKMEWEPDMTLDEFIAYEKEYLYMYYGDGYEYIYEFIEMQDEAGDRCGTCFISNFDRPGDMYSYEYIAENYEYMRNLLVKAYDMADGKYEEDKASKQERIKTMQICFDLFALGCVHTDWYLNGTPEQKALYEERYTAAFNDFVERDMEVYSGSAYDFPKEIIFDINPIVQFYEFGSRREGVYP